MAHMKLQFRACRLLAAGALVAGSLPSSADDWPQWFGPKRDGVWREKGIVGKLPAEPDYRWRVPTGSGYAGPAVAAGRVFVMDRHLATGSSKPDDPFAQGTIPGTERVLCLDEVSGREIWKHQYNAPYTVSYAAGPRATPTVDGEHVFTLGAEGHLKCLDVRSGAVKWEKHFATDYGVKTATWGWASAPLVDGDRLISIVGGEGSIVVAFDKSTGRELWRALSAKEPGYGT
ncbi:MAG TPA: pyrrolo-quinoline quinone, partial [Verrucomicrobiales bacterium]|nr:pyrrolo-quinoline quinone [Verrucomicrobiales bacterium]